MTDYPRLALPLVQLFVAPTDGRVDIETEDGAVLLSFESFDESSGIECKEGGLIREWEAVEAAESHRKAEARKAREASFPSEASFPFTAEGREQLIAARKAWREGR